MMISKYSTPNESLILTKEKQNDRHDRSGFRDFQLKEVLPIVNKLQQIYCSSSDFLTSPRDGGSSSQTGDFDLLGLPELVVIGAQSAGKSSLLEAIIGKDILPRGQGMVTKCPLIIQLQNTSQTTQMEYAEFAHCPKRQFNSSSEIRQEIEDQTNKLLASCSPATNSQNQNSYGTQMLNNKTRGTNYTGTRTVYPSVTRQSILLTYYSPDVLNLTLIDTPGIVRVATASQNSDIVSQIRKIILGIISNPSSLILAVSAANVDLANSDALNIASEVDPRGERTFGVITKCDLVEAPESLVSIVRGDIYPLKYGYTLVKCRGHQSSEPVTSASSSPSSSASEIGCLRQALKDEENFFGTHPIFRTINIHCGVPSLAKSLQSLLLAHISNVLPSFRDRIVKQKLTLENKLQRLGHPLTEADTKRSLLEAFSNFSTSFKNLLDGRTFLDSVEISNSSEDNSPHFSQRGLHQVDLIGGARLNYILQDWFASNVLNFNPLAGLPDKEIKSAIRNASGHAGTLFMPEGAFELLVKNQIRKLEKPAKQCTTQVFQELQNMMQGIRSADMHRFPALREHVLEVGRKVLERCRKPTLDQVSALIKIELAFINKSHPEFIGGRRAIIEFIAANSQPLNGQLGGNNNALGMNNHFGANIATGTGGGGSGGKEGEGKNGVPAVNNENHPGNTNAPNALFPFFWRRPVQVQEDKRNGAAGGDFEVTPRQPSIDGNPTARLLNLPAVDFDSITSDVRTTDRDAAECQVVKALIASYFNIVKRTLADLVPKVIMCYMVTATQETLHSELMTTLYKDELIGELMAEDPKVEIERKMINDKLEIVTAAHSALLALRIQPDVSH